jgi:hypothetical protein
LYRFRPSGLGGVLTPMRPEGQSLAREIVSAVQCCDVWVIDRYPWTLEYDHEVVGALCGGKVIDLSQPDLSQQPGNPLYALFMRDRPA